MGTLLISLMVMAIIATVLGVVIGLTAQIFKVNIDPRIEQVQELLPGANCGGCGFAGCADFAKAVVAGNAPPDGCPVCSQEASEAISEILGHSGNRDKEKMVAIVLCGGSNTKAKDSSLYNGITDCKSAALVAGGPKACKYGCLGFGTCAHVCPFGAIEIIDGLAVVHPEICVGCGKCVEACPRNLIKLVPADAKVHVFCSSPEKGGDKRKVCAAACIGCRKCVKAAEENQMIVKGFLVQVNYDNPPDTEIIEKASCPTGALKTSSMEK